MLPFTTYNIPESSERKTSISAQWLWIVVDKQLSPEENDLLQKICTALKADSTEDVFVFNAGPLQPVSISALASGHLKLIVSFGIAPSNLGIWIDIHPTGIRFLESYTFILSTSLEDLSNSPVAKKQLWNAMRLFLEMK